MLSFGMRLSSCACAPIHVTVVRHQIPMASTRQHLAVLGHDRQISALKVRALGMSVPLHFLQDFEMQESSYLELERSPTSGVAERQLPQFLWLSRRTH